MVDKSRLLNYHRRQLVHRLSADGGTWEEKLSPCVQMRARVQSGVVLQLLTHKPPFSNEKSSCSFSSKLEAAETEMETSSLKVFTVARFHRGAFLLQPLDGPRECDYDCTATPTHAKCQERCRGRARLKCSRQTAK